MFTIREARHTDTEQIIALHFAGLRESGSLSPDSSLDADIYNIAEYYPQDRARFFVAVTDTDQVIGMGAIRKMSDSVYEIKRMRVSAEFRREGIAQAILNQLFEFARRLSAIQFIILDTAEKQLAAQRLYERNGFILDSRQNIGGIPSLIYKKPLRSPSSR